MFRFTDKEDRVGVGVYDVILKYDPGRYMLTMGRKQEPLCQKCRGVTDLLYYHRSDRAERPEKEVKLESRMIGGNYLVRFGGNRRTPISGGNLWLYRTYRELEVAFHRCQVMDRFLQPFFYVLVFYMTDIRLDLLDITEVQ